MKIVIGSESFYPAVSGLATASFNFARELQLRGNEVSVITPSPVFSAGEKIFPAGFKVFQLPSMPNPFRKTLRISLFPSRRILQIVRQIKPDVILVQDPTVIGRGLLRAGKAQNIPVVAYQHFSLEYVAAYLWFLKPVHRWAMRQSAGYLLNFYRECKLLLVPSETLAKKVREMGVEIPVAVLSTGVDILRFSDGATPDRSRYPQVPLVLYSGRMDLDKNIQVLIEAIEKLKGENLYFLFCGGGDRRAGLEKEVRQKGLSGKVSFLGPFPHDSPELTEIYRSADIFVIPSAIETQSIVTMEAMASGLPVVAADSGALPELVKEGENGLLFPPDDAGQLAEKIKILANDVALRKKLGEKSRELIADRALPRTISGLEEHLKKVIS